MIKSNVRYLTVEMRNSAGDDPMDIRVVLLPIVLAVGATISFSQSADTAVIDQFISARAEKEHGEEPDGIRKTVSGDLNHDGVADTAVLYTIEGQNGSNNYIQYLAVFLRSKKGLVYAAQRSVGGKNNREAELTRIADGLVNLNTVDYGPRDPSCCPTIKGTTKYALDSGLLKEKRQMIRGRRR
jgi:hypothetical protein